MSERIGDADETRRDPLYDCLSHPFRRRILAILAERDAAVGIETLAARIDEDKRGTETESDDPGSRSESGIDPIRIALHHVHLPTLADAGLVDWNRDAGTVESADRSLARGGTHDRSTDDWKAIASALSTRRSQLVLSSARDAPNRIDSETLARTVAERERTATGASVSVAEVHISLHHHHLPALADAGLVEYDAENRTVTCRDTPFVVDAWFESHDGRRQLSGPALVRARL